MVIMNEEKDRAASPKMEATKKMCPRAARETTRKTETYVRKPAHTGLKFHFDKKKLITHEFHFNTVSKTEKVTRCRHLDKSSERTNTTENRTTTGSKKIEVLMDTLKISRSEESSNREKSPIRMPVPNSPVVERLLNKKACTRCSGCSKTPKEDKSETKPTKTEKDKDSPLKITKKENLSDKVFKLTPQFLKPTESNKRKQCPKISKVLVESQEKVCKPKSIIIHSDKPGLHDNEKVDASKRCATPQSPKLETSKKHCSKLAKILAEPPEKNLDAKTNAGHTDKSSSNIEKPISEKKVEFAWPSSGGSESMTTETSNPVLHDRGKPEMVNGAEHPSESDTKACLMNGRHDEHLCDPHYGLESPSGTKVSKIPRKTPGAAALKSEGSFHRDIMSEELIAL